jgi:hypothetical protein
MLAKLIARPKKFCTGPPDVQALATELALAIKMSAD